MALFECHRCGTPLRYASQVHPCKGGKETRGGAGDDCSVGKRGARPHQDEQVRARRSNAGPETGVTSRERPTTQSLAKATKGKAGMAAGKPSVRRSTAGTGLRVGEAVAVQPATPEIMDVTAGETAPKSKRGRPRKPFEALSRASKYRRQKEQSK